MPNDPAELSVMAERRLLLASLAQEWLTFPHLRQVLLKQGAPDPVSIDPASMNVEKVVLALLDPARPSDEVERVYVALCRLLADHPSMARAWIGEQGEFDDVEGLSTDALQALLAARNDVFARWHEFQEGMHRVGLTVCQIHIDDAFKGTGFLVGERHVLTAGHCVAPLIDGAGLAVGGSDRRLHVVFDDVLMPGKGRSVYRTDFKVARDWLIKHSPPDDRERSETMPMQDIGEGRLDFALIRLAEPAGRMAPKQFSGAARKWIELQDLAKEPMEQAQILVAHHPGGADLRLTVGLFRDHATASRRVRYLVPTLPGSSGAPCFSSEWKPYALHNAAYPQARVNQGVPLKLIWDAIGGAAAFASAPANQGQMCAVLPDGMPILGRTDIMGEIDAILCGASKTTAIIVTGPKGSGKRFTAELVRTILIDRGQAAFMLDAEIFASDTPEAFAARLVREVGGSAAAAPQPYDPDCRQRARWISRSLSDWIRASVACPLPSGTGAQRTVWVILCHCENVRLSPETNDLLVALLRDEDGAADIGMRYVLTGYDGALLPDEPEKLWRTSLDLISVNGVLPFMQHVAGALSMNEDVTDLRASAASFVDSVRMFSLKSIPLIVAGLAEWRARRVSAPDSPRDAA